MTRPTINALFGLLLAIVAFYWNIVFTNQFSMLMGAETVSQTYSWFHFWAESVRGGRLPLWDRYAFGGHSYIGEMQTAAFYPLHFLFALFPADPRGLMAPRLYHLYFVFAHVPAAYLMFALIRELELSRFSALLAGLCYSIGGFVGALPWPHLLESSVWLPLQFLLILRALNAPEFRRALLFAALSGLAVGMSILAGGLHIVMMQVIVLITAAAFYAIHHRTGWRRPAVVIAVLTITGLAAGAVQLWPSAEYSARSIRFITGTGLPTTEKIPIAYLTDSIWPRTLLSYLIAWNFDGKMGPGEVLVPYFGVFPLLLAIIGIWKYRDHLWVRYSAGLALAAFVFSLGAASLFYGLIYALAPLLWMAREASRFLYLTHFGLMILIAYGAQALFCETESAASWSPLTRVVSWVAIGAALMLAIPAIFGQPELKYWTESSLLLIILTYPLFRYVAAGNMKGGVRFLIVAFILFDLNSFNVIALNRIEAGRTGTDQLERLISMRGAADYLKSLPRPFRVQVIADPPLNFGDAYGIETVNGGAVTQSLNYRGLMESGSPGINLLNVRFFLKPASSAEPDPIYADANWKIYRNPSAYPRAWIEHGGVKADNATEGVDIQGLSGGHIAAHVRAAKDGVLVLSELFYPGWQARVNEKPAGINEVDGGLRGIPVLQGESQVMLDYAPPSVILGAMLSGLTFIFVLSSLAGTLWRR